MRHLTIALLVLPVAAATAPRAEAPQARVLFVGNSLTYANDLPGMIETVSSGRVECESIAYPDFSLEDHWRKGDALAAIRRGGWTHVVLQQGPSSLPESRRVLVQDARRFAREIRQQKAEVVLYGVWPDEGRRRFFDAVTASYAAAAEAADGALVPVGDGWQAAWARDASLPLYGPDGFHPSPMGTYLAALMFTRYFTGQDAAATALPRQVGADARQLAILREAASAPRSPGTPRR